MFQPYTGFLFFSLIVAGLVGIFYGFHLAYRIADHDDSLPGTPRQKEMTDERALRPAPFADAKASVMRLFAKKDSHPMKAKVHSQTGMSHTEFASMEDENPSEHVAQLRSQQDASYAYMAKMKSEVEETMQTEETE